MAIRFYDSKQRSVVPLETREPGRVQMYVCGPTVYNYVHVGNARTFVWFGFIRRYLGYRGFDVTYVMNYTDVDDKIIERSRIEGIPTEGVTSKYERAFEEDMAALGTEPATILVKATDHVGGMVEAIEGLVANGAAYEADGNVWFSVESFPDYGALSGRSLEDLRAGERIEPHEGKRHPLDFALWKSAKEDEPSWPSPWGPGRPGWHIECSVMSTRYLGMGFDVHGGGSDLIFPHHENEVAQAEALAGEKPFVRHWLHSGMVQMGETKMSKSLGNIVLAREAVAAYGGDAVRYWALSASYRSQSPFNDEVLADATAALDRWATFSSAARHALGDDAPAPAGQRVRPEGEEGFEGAGSPFLERFVAAMDDDFNSAEAFAAVHDLVREGNRKIEGAQGGATEDRRLLAELLGAFDELTGVLGFDFESAEGSSELLSGLLDYLIELREQARTEKAFDRADAIRDRLNELGVTLEDTPGGTRWRLGGGA